MGKPLKNIIESVKEELAQYKLSDDFPIEREYLVDKANDCRAALIRDAYTAGKIEGGYYQQMCCIEVLCADVGCEINGVTIPSGQVVWYADLPALVQDIGELNIKYFGLMGFVGNFIRRSWENWLNIEGNVWTSTKPSYTLIGSRAYFKNLPTTGLKFLCLVAILYNPVDSCNYDENTEYPVPSDLTLQTLMCKDILSKWVSFPDPKNDGKFPDVTDTGQARKK